MYIDGSKNKKKIKCCENYIKNILMLQIWRKKAVFYKNLI